MFDQAHLDDLVLRYEELRDEQTPVTPEVLCRDCPELLDELKRKIHVLEAMDAILKEDTGAGGDTPAGRNDVPECSRAPGSLASVAATARLRIVRAHASGGLGEVMVAYDEVLHREVALKRLHEPYALSPQRRRRFLLEAEITSRLEHPGIVPVHAIGRDPEGNPFYAMRLIRGETLREAIQRFHADAGPGDPGERRLALRGLLARFVTVCNTTAYAHSRGVVHRDIKPDNIVLGPFGETLLVDWGLAKDLGRADQGTDAGDACNVSARSPVEGTQLGDVLGTPAYMSPEQAEGRMDLVGPAADVYGLGATLYALLTGRPAFEGGPTAKVLEQVCQGEFPQPRLRKADIAPALEAVCLRAMARQPDQRYGSAQELAADVEHWLADEPVSAWREPWPVRVRRWLGRHRTVAVGVGATTATAVVLIVVSAWLLLTAYRRESAAHVQTHENFVKAQLALAKSYNNQGNLFQSLRLQDRAEKAYQSALRVLEELPDASAAAVGVQAQKAHAANSLGLFYQSTAELAAAEKNLLQSTAELAAAEKYLLQARDIHERLVQTDSGAARPQDDLATVWHNLAILYQATGRHESAESALVRSLEIRHRLVQAHADRLDYLHSLVMSYHQLGTLCQKNGQHDRAKKAYQDSVSVGDRLIQRDYRSSPFFLTRGQTCCALGDLATSERDAESMRDWFARAVTALQDAPKHLETQRRAFWGRAVALTGLNRLPEALPDWEQVLALDAEQSRLPPRPGKPSPQGKPTESRGSTTPRVDQGHTLFQTACTFARASQENTPSESGSFRRPEQYADLAVKLLDRAYQIGFFQSAGHRGELEKAADLNPLRGRPDFQRLHQLLKEKKR